MRKKGGEDSVSASRPEGGHWGEKFGGSSKGVESERASGSCRGRNELTKGAVTAGY